ncbi:MAG: hypothetical protein WAN35_05170 [Terracidiphilus sp.]
MRGINRRSLRLELVAGLVVALAMPALAVPSGVDTTTTLTAQSTQVTQYKENAVCSLSTLAVNVSSSAGVPAGTVIIWDETPSPAVQLASATLDTKGNATFSLALETGAHSLSAVYAGVPGSFVGSSSAASAVSVSSQCDSTFVVTVSTGTTGNALILTPGEAGKATVTVTPLQSSVPSTAPLFVTLSCSGLSDMANCNYTPENVEISPGQDAGVTSDMVIQTYAASSTSLKPTPKPGQSSASIAWALLLPGVFGLGGLAWGARRRRFLCRLSLVALVGVVTLLGTTGCNPRYSYEHHGPVPNPATPAGTYTLLVTAQSSNGVTAITHSATLTLTVN